MAILQLILAGIAIAIILATGMPMSAEARMIFGNVISLALALVVVWIDKDR